MRLPSKSLSVREQLAEFDVWITPALGEIRDTDRFLLGMDAVLRVFDRLSHASGNFADEAHCQPAAIVTEFVAAVQSLDREAAEAVLSDLAAVLFLVTGQSDNNAKCQLPLFLKEVLGWIDLPTVRVSRGTTKLGRRPIPRSLEAAKFMALVASLQQFPDQQRLLLGAFVEYVLATPRDIEQLWSVGRSYTLMKQMDRHRQLLTALVSFQVRGSVAASGGHEPERILRALMSEWGLEPGEGYNEADVSWPAYEALAEPASIASLRQRVAESGQEITMDRGDVIESTGKRRAWDFVLPFGVSGWTPGIFIQSQFYAGDSGSVSHKNVDQTPRARDRVKAVLDEARFIELVDGAGYFSALNGDLKHLLELDDTTSFVQLRSAPIRLRRELQELGFLTPLEVAHAVLSTGGDWSSVSATLRLQGYSGEEIERAIGHSLTKGWLTKANDVLFVTDERRVPSRRYAILDCIAVFGAPISAADDVPKGMILIPGYGRAYGMHLDELAQRTAQSFPSLRYDLEDSHVFEADIAWLLERGFVIAS